MRRLVFLLVSLGFLLPSYSIGFEVKPWNAESHQRLIEIRSRFYPTKKYTFSLMWKARWKEFQLALKKGDLKKAEELQHRGYCAYLNWLEDRGAVTYYYHHLMVRNL